MLTSRDPEATGCFSSDRRETLDIRPSVGESTMHQALPVPDCTFCPTFRSDRAAAKSREFWKRCLANEEGAIAEKTEEDGEVGREGREGYIDARRRGGEERIDTC